VGWDTAYEHCPYSAKALYACACQIGLAFPLDAEGVSIDTASPDDPNEISFSKGEVLDIVDKNTKWWQARKVDGTVGST
jgi:SHO1 osmosensor